MRLRLLLWFGFCLAILIAGFGFAACHIQKTAQLGRIDAELAERVDLVSGAFRQSELHSSPPPGPKLDFAAEAHPHPPPDMGRHGPPRHFRAPVQLPDKVVRQFGPGWYFAVWGAQENRLLVQSTAMLKDLPKPNAATTQTLLRYRTRDTLREAYQFTERSDCVLAGCDLAPELARFHRFAWKIAAAGGLILLLGLGGGYLASGLLLVSIRQIGGTARRISEGSLAERIPTGDMDRELAQLADVLNATFARLDAAFERQRQFTADAAHELRTPLAVIISDAQTALRRDRSSEEYRDTIRACEQAAQRMRRLADSLLELARLDAGREQGQRTPADLAQIAADCIAQLRLLAAERNIRIETDLQPAPLVCHPDQLARVFLNLIANALEYNRPEGRIQVNTGTQNGEIIAVVADTGIGIAPEDLPRIFERFHRAAVARSRAEDHAGLGLAICKAIVEAHGGRIVAVSTPGSGTTVTLHWPGPAAQA